MFFNIAVRRNQMNAIARPMPLIITIGVVGTFVLIMTGVIGPILAAVLPTGAELENSQEKPIAVTTSAPPQKSVAILDDDVSSTSVFIEFLSYSQLNFIPSHFIDCASLIAVMNTGKRFDLYILDYFLDDIGASLGTACIPEIRALHPSALIVGRSGSSGKHPYQSQNIPWIDKMEGSKYGVEFIEKLFR
jgi:hypothetical protein